MIFRCLLIVLMLWIRLYKISLELGLKWSDLNLVGIFSNIKYLHEVTGSSFEFAFVLQGKRGIEKQPFQLPDFIAATGIEKIRQVQDTLGALCWKNLHLNCLSCLSRFLVALSLVWILPFIMVWCVLTSYNVVVYVLFLVLCKFNKKYSSCAYPTL